MSFPAPICLALSLFAFAAAGCGSDGDDEPADAGLAVLAVLAPAETTVYAETVLRPEGEQRESLESSLELLLGTSNPGGAILEKVEEALAESDTELSYSVDVEPWLGERGALLFTDIFSTGDGPSLGENGERGAFLIEVTDAEAAEEFVAAAAADQGDTEERSYEGVDYRVDDEGVAGGLVGEHVVFGDEPTFRQVVDTEAGAPALADEESFASTAEEAAESVAGLYVDVPDIVAAAEEAGELEGSDRELLESVFSGFAEVPLTASVEAEPNAFALEVSHGAADVPFLDAAGESSLLRELPDDAWLGVGFNDLGGAVGSLLESGGQLGIGADQLADAEEQFRDEYGLALEDFYGPLGDGALFAAGRGIFGTGGGLTVEADSAEAAERVLAALREGAQRAGEVVEPLRGGRPGVAGFSVAIPEAPGALNFVASGDRLVIAYGDQAAASALAPDDTLPSNGEFELAAEELGDEFAVGFYLDTAPPLELLGFAAAAEPSLQEAMPYLRAVDFVIAGSAAEGEIVRQRLLVGLATTVEGPAT